MDLFRPIAPPQANTTIRPDLDAKMATPLEGAGRGRTLSGGRRLSAKIGRPSRLREIETVEQVVGLRVVLLQRHEAEARLDQREDRGGVGNALVDVAAPRPGAYQQCRHPGAAAIGVGLRRRHMVPKTAAFVVGDDDGTLFP